MLRCAWVPRNKRTGPLERGPGEGPAGSANWCSYDQVAREYDRVWGDRFEEAARHVWNLIHVRPGATLLDIGTGTGIVPGAVGADANGRARLVGCDRSRDMLRVASTRVTQLRVVAAHAEALPFADAAFDVVTASFVLSHLRDYRVGIAEAHRVLKSSAMFATASWTAKADPQSEAWKALLAEALSATRLQDASAEVTPSEAYFERAENVGTALTEAGFTGIDVRAYALQGRASLEQFLADRALSSSGRFARQAMSQSDWPRFLEHAREELARAFGTDLSYSRGFLVGLGRRG